MTYLPSLPEDASLVTVLHRYEQTYRQLLGFHQEIMRGPSPLTAAERETIAAYVSGLNRCQFCFGVHSATATALGMPAGAVSAALHDIDTTEVPQRLAPLLRYVRKLTLAAPSITAGDAQAVFDAGFEERALHDAIAVGAMFNMMNRLVDGLGIVGDEPLFGKSGQILAEAGYRALLGDLPE